MTTTKTIQGINFQSEVIDINKARPSDLLTIAFLSIKDEMLPTNKEMAMIIKEKSINVEIIKNPKMFELNAKFI